MNVITIKQIASRARSPPREAEAASKTLNAF
jgi:hypothetical protein